MGDRLLTGRSSVYYESFAAHELRPYRQNSAELFLRFFRNPSFKYDKRTLAALLGSAEGRFVNETDVDAIVARVASEPLYPPPLRLRPSGTVLWWLLSTRSREATALRVAKTDGSTDTVDRLTYVIVHVHRPRVPSVTYERPLAEDVEFLRGRDPFERALPLRLWAGSRAGASLCRHPLCDAAALGYRRVSVTADPDYEADGSGTTRLVLDEETYELSVACRYGPHREYVVDLLRVMCSFPREYYFDVSVLPREWTSALVSLLAGECVERDATLHLRPLKLTDSSSEGSTWNFTSCQRMILRDESLRAELPSACGLRAALGSPALTVETDDLRWLRSVDALMLSAYDKIGPRLTLRQECGTTVTWPSETTSVIYVTDSRMRWLETSDEPRCTLRWRSEGPEVSGRFSARGEVLRATIWTDPQTRLDDPRLYARTRWTSSEFIRLSVNAERCDAGSFRTSLYVDERGANVLTVPQFNTIALTHTILLLQAQKRSKDDEQEELTVLCESVLSPRNLRDLLEALGGARDTRVAVHFVCYLRAKDLENFLPPEEFPIYTTRGHTSGPDLNWSDDPAARSSTALPYAELPRPVRARWTTTKEETLTRARAKSWVEVPGYSASSEGDSLRSTCVLCALKYPCRFSTEGFWMGLPRGWHRGDTSTTRWPSFPERNKVETAINHYLRVPAHCTFLETLKSVQKKTPSVPWASSRIHVINRGQADVGADYPDRLLEITACHLLGHPTSVPLPDEDNDGDARLLSSAPERLPLGLVPYPVNDTSFVKKVLENMEYVDILYETMPVYSFYYDEAVTAGFVLSRLSGRPYDLSSATLCLQTLMKTLYASSDASYLAEWFMEQASYEADMASYLVQTSAVHRVCDNVYVLERTTHSCFLNTMGETPPAYAALERALRAWIGDDPTGAYAKMFGPVTVLKEPSRNPRRLGSMRLWQVVRRVVSRQTPLAVLADGTVLLFIGYAPCYVHYNGVTFFRWSPTKPLVGLFTTKTRYHVSKASVSDAQEGEDEKKDIEGISAEATAQLRNTYLSLPYGTEYRVRESQPEMAYKSSMGATFWSTHKETTLSAIHRSRACTSFNALFDHPEAALNSLSVDREGVSVPTAVAASPGESLRVFRLSVSSRYTSRQQPSAPIQRFHGGFSVGGGSESETVLSLDEEQRAVYELEKVCCKPTVRVEASFRLHRDETLQRYTSRLFLLGESTFVRCFTTVRYTPLASSATPVDVPWEDRATLDGLYRHTAFLRVCSSITFNPCEYETTLADGSQTTDGSAWSADQELPSGAVLRKLSPGAWDSHYTLLCPSKTALFAAVALLLRQYADYVKIVLEPEGLETPCINYVLESASLFGYAPKRVLVLGRASRLASTGVLTDSDVSRHVINDPEAATRRPVLRVASEPSELIRELIDSTSDRFEWLPRESKNVPWDYSVRGASGGVVSVTNSEGVELGRYSDATDFADRVSAEGLPRYVEPLEGDESFLWFEKAATLGELENLARGLNRLAYSYSPADFAATANRVISSGRPFLETLTMGERLDLLVDEYIQASAARGTAEQPSDSYDRLSLAEAVTRAEAVLRVVPQTTRVSVSDLYTGAFQSGDFTRTVRVRQLTERLSETVSATKLSFLSDEPWPAIRLLWTYEYDEWLLRFGVAVYLGDSMSVRAPDDTTPWPRVYCLRSTDSIVRTLWSFHGLCGEEPVLMARDSAETELLLASVRLFLATYDLIAGPERVTTFRHVNLMMGGGYCEASRRAYVGKLTAPWVSGIAGDTVYKFSVSVEASVPHYMNQKKLRAQSSNQNSAFIELVKRLKKWLLEQAEMGTVSGLPQSLATSYWKETFRVVDEDAPNGQRWLGRLLLSSRWSTSLEPLTKHWNRYHIFVGSRR